MEIFTITGMGYDSNIFIILGKTPSIVDTGTGLNSRYVVDNISKFIEIGKLKQIILTHEHYDHIGGVEEILKKTENTAKIIAHKNVALKISQGRSDFAEMLGGKLPKVKINYELSGGEEIILGDENFEVLNSQMLPN